MFFGGESADDYLGDFSAIGPIETVVVTQPDFSGIAGEITSGALPFDPFADNLSLAIDTLNIYLESLSDTLAADVLNLRLPFVGDQLADVLFLEEVRESLVGTLKAGIENAAIEPGHHCPKLAHGPVRRGWRARRLPGETRSVFENVGNVGVLPADYRRQWNFTIGHQDVVWIDDFDLGIDNLDFDVSAPVKVVFDWTLDLGFGVNFGEAAYIDLSGTEQLDVDLTITLDTGTHTGEFGYMRMDVSDPGSDSARIDVQFDVDMQNANTGGDKLGFSDLGGFEAVAKVAGQDPAPHALSVHMVTQPVLGLPTMSADLVVDWTLTSTPVADLEGDGVTPGVQLIELNSMTLDSGSMADAILGPLLGKVGEFIEPFMPVIDTLTARSRSSRTSRTSPSRCSTLPPSSATSTRHSSRPSPTSST